MKVNVSVRLVISDLFAIEVRVSLYRNICGQ
jgi:hypothetical protein